MTRSIKHFLFAMALAAVAAERAQALSLRDLKPLGLDCRIAMSVENVPFFEKLFEAPLEGGTHGGNGQVLDAGSGYTIEMLADGRWMAITWNKGAETLARGLFAWNGGDVEHRVAILYGTKNPSDNVALSCSRQQAK